MKSIIRHATFLLIHKKGQTKKKVTFSVPSFTGESLFYAGNNQ